MPPAFSGSESTSYGLFAGEGFTIVVFDSFFSAGLVTLVSFFSHAVNSANVIARKIYFFMSSYAIDVGRGCISNHRDGGLVDRHHSSLKSAR